jgi:hypothetical protein
MKKLSAWLGIVSILWSNVTFAMLPQKGDLIIHGESIRIDGAPPPQVVASDISSVTHEDFDVTAFSVVTFAMDNCRHMAEEREAQELHFDTSIPFIGGEHPKVDYKALRLLPLFISRQLGDKIYLRTRGAALKFVQTLAQNETALDPATQIIPDMDCLYYKMVDDQQRLFLRLSSQTRREAEIFKQNSSGKTLFVEKGDAKVLGDQKISLDHIVADPDNISCVAGETILNRASKMKAEQEIRLRAPQQRHETVINKWTKIDSGKHHYTHAEGVESVDDCSFAARRVVQEGDEVENFGIFVEADEFEDRGTRTTNMPAKITLYNYAWAEKSGLLSHAESSVSKKDDVLVPTRYHVNYYRSLPSGETSRPLPNVISLARTRRNAAQDRNVLPVHEDPSSGSDEVDCEKKSLGDGLTSVKFGYTIINSGSKIEVLKDVKEDVVVEEKHTVDVKPPFFVPDESRRFLCR